MNSKNSDGKTKYRFLFELAKKATVDRPAIGEKTIQQNGQGP